MEKKQEKIDAKYVVSELDGLRKKILDFSRRNRLLNFKHARGQDYIRVVDEIPQLLFNKLQDQGMYFKALPDMDQEPADQKGNLEFQQTLSDEKATNPEYQKKLDSLDENASETEQIEIENWIVDLVRSNLKMPEIPRGPKRDMSVHAELHGYNPDYSLSDISSDEEHNDDEIQTLLLQEDLDRRLRNIFRKFQDNRKETGLNNFHCIFGFLEWPEAENNNQENFNFSPLLNIKVRIEKKRSTGGYKYRLFTDMGEYEVNETLKVKLENDLGVELPIFNPDVEDPLETFFKDIEKVVETRVGWKFHRFVTFGFLPFTKIEIYNDIDPSTWEDGESILDDDLVARLLGGLNANSTSTITENEQIDKLTIMGEAPALIMPADSSQHSAIKRGIEDSLVIQGPPGTGKSQTIANLIATAAAEGKKVLFLAEKQPALEVVQQRLKSKGLQNIIFNPTKTKEEIYGSLEESISMMGGASGLIEHDKRLQNTGKGEQDLIKSIKLSDKLKKLYAIKTNFCSLSFNKLLWKKQKLEKQLSKYVLPPLDLGIENADEEYLDRNYSLIDQFMEKVYPFKEEENRATAKLQLPDNIISVETFMHEIETANKAVSEFKEKLDKLDFLAPLQKRAFEAICQKLDTLIEGSNEEIKNSFRLWAQKEKVKAHIESLRLLKNIEDNFATFPEFFETRVGSLRQIEQISKVEKIDSKSFDENIRVSKLNELAALTSLWSALNDYELNFIGSFHDLRWVFEHCNGLPENTSTLLSENLGLLENINGEDAEKFFQKLKEAKELSATLNLAFPISFENGKHYISFDSKKFDHEKIALFQKTLSSAGVFTFSATNNDYRQAKEFLQLTTMARLPKSEWQAKMRGLVKLMSNCTELEQNKLSHALGENFLGINSDLVKMRGLLEALINVEASVKAINQKIPENVNSVTNSKLVSFLLHKKEIEQLFVDEYQSLMQIVEPNRVIFSDNFDELSTLEQNFRYIEEINNILESFSIKDLLNDGSYDLIQEYQSADLTTKYNKAKELYEVVYEKYLQDAPKFSPENLGEIIGILDSSSNVERDEAMSSISRKNVFDEIGKSGNRNFFEAIKNVNGLNGESAKNYFQLVCVKNILQKLLSQNGDDFISLSGPTLRKNKRLFRDADENLYKHNVIKIQRKITNNPVSFGNSTGKKDTYTDLSFIKWNLSRPGKSPVRTLVDRSFDAIISMKPIWFMQPISVSKFLPKTRNIFDLVIIDEASQMLPQMAIAAMARSKKIIVVGDNQQMPPQSYFSSDLDYDEELAPETDAESILDLASERIGNTVSLGWHYRSKHPSLINFSNYHFYNNRLEIFPTPIEENVDELGVKLIEVEGTYSGANINSDERNEVIRQVKESINRSPEDSIGIVTMNVQQRDLILQSIDQLRDTDDEVRAYFNQMEQDDLNALFVKNLVNVQGDERDVIIISTIFGKNENGQVAQRFGNINNRMGHRFLNVLFTRAKKRVVLVTSMKPSDVRINETSSKGVLAFKDYLEYAKTGKVDKGEVNEHEADSDFEVFVGNYLREIGFEATYQVGVRGFRIDIGVKHENYPYGFLAGIECDGSTYHSSLAARDRDRVRQDILEGFGWKIYRIWSTDWFNSPEIEKNKLKSWLDKLVEDLTRKDRIVSSSENQELNEIEITDQKENKSNADSKNTTEIDRKLGNNFFKIEEFETFRPISRNSNFKPDNAAQMRWQNNVEKRLLNHGFPVTEEEIVVLSDRFKNGETIEELEDYFQRSKITILNLLQKEGFDVNNETRDEKQAQDTLTFIELDDVPEGNEEEILSPTGRERELNHGDKNIIYFEPRFGLYEIWNKEQTLKLGDVERTPGGVTEATKFVATSLEGGVYRNFDDIYEALRWLYDKVS